VSGLLQEQVQAYSTEVLEAGRLQAWELASMFSTSEPVEMRRAWAPGIPWVSIRVMGVPLELDLGLELELELELQESRAQGFASVSVDLRVVAKTAAIFRVLLPFGSPPSSSNACLVNHDKYHDEWPLLVPSIAVSF